MTRAREIVALLGLGLAGVAVLLAVLEVALRVAASFEEERFDVLMDRPRVVENRPLFLWDLIRRHPDDAVVYELRPGTRGRFQRHEVRINSLGMRGEEIAREKPVGTFRVLVLGDSQAFGWGVGQDETFPAVVEELLTARSPDTRIEVLNAGVPGYNTVQEARVFELRAGELEPDLVLINFVDNDMDLPNFLAIPPDPWNFSSSFVATLVRRRVEHLRGIHLAPEGLIGVPIDPQDRYRLPVDRIPVQYRPLQGWDNMVAAYKRLARLARERAIPYAIAFNWNDYRPRLSRRVEDVLPPGVRELAEACEREGYLVIDPQERILRYLRVRDLPNEVLTIESDEVHSSSLRNRLLAEEIVERLGTAGQLPRE